MLEPFVLKGTGYWKDMVASASSYRSSHNVTLIVTKFLAHGRLW